MIAVANLLKRTGSRGMGAHALRGVIAVIQSNANNLWRIGNGREQLGGGSGMAHGIGPRRCLGRAAKQARAGRQQILGR